jgi:hypothetical protein
MAYPLLTTDLDFILALSDLPNETDNMTADELKAMFDAGPNAIKTWINTVLLVALESNTAGSSGAQNLGSAPISGVAGTKVWDQLSDLKSQISAMILGVIADGTLTAAKMAADMSKDISGGITSYSAYTANNALLLRRRINDQTTAVMGGLF